MREYPFGQAVELRAEFADEDGAPTTPTVATFRVGRETISPPPSPSATSFVNGVDSEVSVASAGDLRCVFVPAASGVYVYDATGTGNMDAATVPRRFKVLPSPFA
jgi:hypothetical protein